MNSTLHTGTSDTEVRRCVVRALADFELMDAFGERSAVEREGCLRWVERASTDGEQAQRISRLLDDLYQGNPLAGACAGLVTASSAYERDRREIIK